MPSLNHQHLLYFWTAVKEGSITKAAKKLYLSQSTVSDQIIQLEKFFGHRLLVRQKNKLLLTEEGKTVLGYANDIFNTSRELIQTVRGSKNPGHLRFDIGIDDNVSRQAALKLIETAYRFNPHAEINAYEGIYKDHMEHMRMHNLDLVLADQSDTEDAGDYLKSEAGRLEMFFMASPKLVRQYKNKSKGYSGMPLILPARENPISGSIEKFFMQKKISPNIIGRVQDVELMKLLVLGGHAAAPFHEVATAAELKEGTLVRLGKTPTGITKTLWLIAKKRLRMNPLAVYLLGNFRVP